jgi:hypothetical protein
VIDWYNMCKNNEETLNHILLHCEKKKVKKKEEEKKIDSYNMRKKSEETPNFRSPKVKSSNYIHRTKEKKKQMHV